MKKYIIAIVIIISYCGVALLNAQGDREKSEDEKLSIFDLYLGLDCSVTEQPQEYLEQLKKDPEAATAYFITFFEKGLSAKARKELEKEIQPLFELRSSYLYSKQGIIQIGDGNGREKTWNIEQVSEAKFIENQMRSFEDQLQVRAIEGLVALNTKRGNQFLKRLMDNPDYKFQKLIEELLE